MVSINIEYSLSAHPNTVFPTYPLTQTSLYTRSHVPSHYLPHAFVRHPFEERLDLSMASTLLPPRPPSICPSCWDGPFAARLGFLGKPLLADRTEDKSVEAGGYKYTITPEKLTLQAKFGCTWCMFLVRCIREMNKADDLKKSEHTLCIRVGRKGDSRILSVSVNNVETKRPGYIATTTPGAYSGHQMESWSRRY